MSQTKVKSGLLNFPDQTDFVKLPSGTTAQRPSSPEKGYSRYNTTDNKLEYWNGTIWQQLPGVVAPTIESVSYPGDDLAADPAGGQTITLTGNNFLDGASIEIDGTTSSVVTVVSKTEITFTAPAKTAGDYDILLTNGDNTTATFIDGITYNGLPSWTTPAGNLGTFPAGSTIPTITLVATEPDSGVVSYSVTTGALPTGLALTGADIDGTVPSPAGQTTYNFSIKASDDENQESTERAFNIVVYLQVTNTVDDHDPFDGNGVALYKLNGDATDESGNYNGTATNVTYGTGQFGQAGVFNGSTSVINLGNVLNTTLSNNFTISAWINTNSMGGQIFGKGFWATNGEYVRFYTRTSTPRIQFGFEDGSGNNVFMSSNSENLEGTGWRHIVAVGDYSGSFSLYLDGQHIESQTVNGSMNMTNSSSAYIGNRESNNAPFNGSIDQVRIFSRALRPYEVESLYRERTVVCGGQADTLDILGDNSCIATYQLNGNANDLSGNYSGQATNVSYEVGEFDLAGVFNGSSYINTGINLNSNSNSVSCWVKITDGTKENFLGVLEGSNRFYFGVRESNFHLGAGDTQKYTVSAANLLDGNWHHVVYSLNGSLAVYYLDGQVADSTSYSGGGAFSLNAFIGALNNSGTVDNQVNGSIDQVRIFNKALNSTEVTTLYNETACDALACSGTTNTLDILSDGSCIAAYPLDGSPADLSGNYNGVQTDVTYPVGEFDLAGAFNGTSSFIDLGASSQFSASAVSFSLWYKPNTVSNTGTLLGNTDGGGFVPQEFFWYQWNDGKLFFGYAQSSTTYVQLFSTSTFSVGTWYFLSFIIDPSATNKFRLYINGAEDTLVVNAQGGTFTAHNVLDTSLQLNIGKRNISGSESYLNGEIDQVRIFNKALSAGEVTTLYNETACN